MSYFEKIAQKRKKTCKKRNFELRRILENKFVTSENVTWSFFLICTAQISVIKSKNENIKSYDFSPQ